MTKTLENTKEEIDYFKGVTVNSTNKLVEMREKVSEERFLVMRDSLVNFLENFVAPSTEHLEGVLTGLEEIEAKKPKAKSKKPASTTTKPAPAPAPTKAAKPVEKPVEKASKPTKKESSEMKDSIMGGLKGDAAKMFEDMIGSIPTGDTKKKATVPINPSTINDLTPSEIEEIRRVLDKYVVDNGLEELNDIRHEDVDKIATEIGIDKIHIADVLSRKANES